MTEETEQHSDNHDFGPGALLKRTREEKEISLDEVSERLKLTKSVLTQIESDEYAGDLPVTFYRGYVKNYAEFLELNETDVLANFEQFCRKNNLLKSPSAPRVEGMSLEKSVNSNNWLFKIVTGLIILALVVAIYYIVVEKELWKKVIPAGQETEQLETDDQGLELDNYEGDDGQPNSESSGSLSLPTDASQDANGADEDGSLELNTLESKNSEDSTDNDPRDDAGSLPLGDSDVSSSVAEDAQHNSSNVSATAKSSQSLFLSFTNDCWVRIEDATGKVLALGIKSAGTNLQLSGKTPYYLNLGKASAVELSFDGNEIDLSQYPDTRAAKLTLGDS
ncbi:MAG: helix-turn-helix domain-containing protein [Rickettsiales bacterium]|nr:helix-turn-helix domain-containing protein [Rickettsiales bacterium]